MSRKIKFRAWDEESGTMIYSENDEVGFDDLPVVWQITNGEMMVEIPELNMDNQEMSSRYIKEFIMQFTDLLDKNGKEIYEGDIIRNGVAGNGYEHTLPTYIVEYIPGAILPRGLNNPDMWWTVIGNIYEHPELLKN